MARMSTEQVAKAMSAVENAKTILTRGDRIRSTRCGGREATYTFECWDGNWIVSKSGIDDIAAGDIYRLNGQPVDFTTPLVVSMTDAELLIKAADEKRDEMTQVNLDGSVPF